MADADRTKYFVISQQDGYEWGGSVVGITRSQVVASMATQAGWQVWTNLPCFGSTQEFIEWSETSTVSVSANG